MIGQRYLTSLSSVFVDELQRGTRLWRHRGVTNYHVIKICGRVTWKKQLNKCLEAQCCCRLWRKEPEWVFCHVSNPNLIWNQPWSYDKSTGATAQGTLHKPANKKLNKRVVGSLWGNYAKDKMTPEDKLHNHGRRDNVPQTQTQPKNKWCYPCQLVIELCVFKSL